MKKSLFGYHPREVEKKLGILEKEIYELRDKNSEQGQVIAELKEKLIKAEFEEDIIKEAIIDAKHLSKRLIREAKEQAAEMLQDAEKKIEDQFAQFETTMATLNDMKNKVIAQKNELTKELNDIVYRYRKVLQQDEPESFEEIATNINEVIQETEKIVGATKKVILLPKMDDNKREEAPTLDLNDEIPVYTFR
ncbi:TPA: DivIVA domain-containing protein [Streptococcus suis]|uniref:DivIVA domain-containing protein n=1 Tax=Streptococcus suis TaxID=1307 RepID=UPI0021179382|nr:DivIVA domain-containing protein [Streptococcus suis]MCQ8263806.1 DivIVA domain-containing protein [Streptococcus suis]HEL1662462.1 DivIVA domain-containing protein [Streptococcus suis]HEL1767948.1 DivIVA domain-containing protein [Streptococcus suis]HEL1961785.1 DivIVA domain-containing protein [Streptococcus suis]HEL1968783.1 DivIVA domain-containing protein [Streptococcus suis]